jgi:hypothetical protein
VDLLGVLDNKGKVEAVQVGIRGSAPGGRDGLVDTASGGQVDHARAGHGTGDMDHHRAGGRITGRGVPSPRLHATARLRVGLRLPGTLFRCIPACRFGAARTDSAQGQDFRPPGCGLPPEQRPRSYGKDSQEDGDAHAHPPPQRGPHLRGAKGCRTFTAPAPLKTVRIPLLRAQVFKRLLTAPFQQEAPGAGPKGGLQPVPGMARLMTCCSSIPA